MKIRTVRVADAEGITTTHVESWLSAYRGIIPVNFLAKLSAERRAIWWRGSLGNVNSSKELIEVAYGWPDLRVLMED